MSITTLVHDLRALGLDARAEPAVSGFGINQFLIGAGRFAGSRVDIAIPIDFPLTPPGGIHIRQALFPIGNDGKNNVLPSPQIPGWQYFSRSYPGWDAKKGSARSVLAYVNKVFLDA